MSEARPPTIRKMTIFSLTIATLLATCSYILYAVFLSHIFSPYRGLPKPKQPPLPFRILHEPTSFEITRWVRMVPNDGFIRYFGMLNQERLIITTVEAYKELLLRDVYKYDKLSALAAVQWPLGVSGLVSAKGILHKIHRGQTIAAYNATWARTIYPKVWETAQEAVNSLADRAAGPDHVVQVNRFLREVCLDTIGHVGFSLNLGALANPDGEVTKRYLHGFDVGESAPFYLKLLQICPKPLEMLAATVIARTVLRIDISEMELLIRGTVANKLKYLGDRGRETCGPSFEDRPLDLMDMLCLRGQPRISKRSLDRHALTIVAASVEMISNQLSWAIYTLSLPRHQHVQNKLRDEIRSHFPVSHKSVTAKDIACLAYLNGVVNEVLRLYPSVAARFRICNTPATLLGRSIRRGTSILWPIYSMNRNPDLWGPDADELCPERWIGDSTEKRNVKGTGTRTRRDAYAFMTFGQGLHRCPGEHYTRIVMACVLANLVGHFQFTMPRDGDILAGTQEKVGFGIVMKAPIVAKVEKVPGW